jgi:hypothetical protein
VREMGNLPARVIMLEEDSDRPPRATAEQEAIKLLAWLSSLDARRDNDCFTPKL